MQTIGGKPECEGLLQNEAGLRERPLRRVDEQHDAIDHRQGPLHFTTEVRVTGRVDDVDARARVVDRSILRENRDAALALERERVHHTLCHLLVLTEQAALGAGSVHERGLPVVDVGDDGDVADVLADKKRRQTPRLTGTPRGCPGPRPR